MAKYAITFAIILFRKTGVSKVLSFCIFCPCFSCVFVYIAHFAGFFKIRIAFSALLLYNTNQNFGLLNRLLNIKQSATKKQTLNIQQHERRRFSYEVWSF